MASVNLKDLAEVQTVGTNQNLLLFGETDNVASRIDYDKLAEAILNKTRNEIGGVSPISAIATLQSTVYTTVLSSTTYSTKADALAALDAYITSVGNGRRFTGYIGSANSEVLGLYKTSHYFDCYANSANYRLLVVRPVNGNGIHWLAKTGDPGTWANVWGGTPEWVNDSIVKITTSLTTFVDNHPMGIFYAWSPSASGVGTQVGAPSDGVGYHYLIIKTNGSTALVVAFAMAASGGIIATKQKYGNSWGSWTTRFSS